MEGLQLVGALLLAGPSAESRDTAGSLVAALGFGYEMK